MDIPTLHLQFGASHGVALRNIANVSHEQSLVRPQPGGNCLNWVLGHLLASRSGMLEVLGVERPLSREDSRPYDRGCVPLVDEDAWPIEKLLQLFADSQEPLMTALAAVTADRLAEPAPFSPGGREDETVASLLALFAFHESYHVGQTGILRRMAGLDGAIP